MCLEILATISPDAKGRISADRLSEITGLKVTSRKVKGVSALHFSVTGGCSCEFLSDDAEFEAETWALSETHLPALAQAISALCGECKEFSFIARWLTGERPRRSEKVPGSKLEQLMSGNAVGNNVLYLVG